MRYAINSLGKRSEVLFSGEIGKCEECAAVVIGRKGRIRPRHWYHKSKNDCDSWHEPITQWHLQWQNLFPKKYREANLKDEHTNTKHRADICLNNSLVIEIQNSSISIDEIEQRGKFYGKDNMIWVLNGTTLATHSKVEYRFIKEEYTCYFQLPDDDSALLPYYKVTSLLEDLFKLHDFNSSFIAKPAVQNLIKSQDLKDYYINRWGNIYTFKFNCPQDFSAIEELLQRQFKETLLELYGNEDRYSDYEVQLFFWSKNTLNHGIVNIELIKKYWRRFIDEMKYPVFLDNMSGLDDNYLFWYQENAIIRKSNFINKYLCYT